MFKKLAGKLFGKGTSEPSTDGFHLNVRCSECSVTYALKKEVYGVGCKNRIYVNMKFDGGKKLISREIENGEYIEKEP